MGMQTEWVYEEEELSGSQPAVHVDGLVAQVGGDDMALASKLSSLELENKALKKGTEDLKGLILKLEARVSTLEGGKPAAAPAPAKEAAKEEDDDDDDVDPASMVDTEAMAVMAVSELAT